jgi:ATP-binding cassette subfamily B protein RaxB
LSDIALTPRERGHDRPLAYATPIRGGIELRDVSFRYAETERFVLENVSSRSSRALRDHHGPVGRRQDDAAEDHARPAGAHQRRVLVDGVPLQTVGVRVYREQVAR